MKEEVTPWFPGSVKPVRAGHYQRDYGDPELDLIPDIWTGAVWLYGWSKGCPRGLAAEQDRPWRGLFTPLATYAKGSK